MVRLPIEGVPVDCTCTWDWLEEALRLVRTPQRECVIHGDPTGIVIGWLSKDPFRDPAVGIARGTEPRKWLPEFCKSAVTIAKTESRAGKVWRGLGRSWKDVDWDAVIAALREETP